MLRISDLEIATLGSGPRVVLVHGSVVGARTAWRRQEALAERWTLCMPNRPGFGASAPLTRGDFDAEAPLIAELLGEGAHLVGHSYGAVIALLAAALRPDAVRSLTVSEPGSLQIAAGHPEVDATIAGGTALYARRDEFEPEDFLRLFRNEVDAESTRRGLSGELLQGARMLMCERPAWEAVLPLEALRRAPFETLVISGGHSEVFDAVCDALAEQIGARRAVVPGLGHAIPATGAPYNDCLENFFTSCAAAGPAPPPSS
ncbi:MAG: alpha/beta hydrolase [Solirubrobacteraceae bacterium]